MANKVCIRKYESGIDVVTAAKQRIVNIFSNGLPVYMSISGGKDSICLNHLVYELVKSEKIDKSRLTVVFIDEEGIYPCIERIVKNIRQQWILAGVKFDWYAMQYKHFNCLNQLTNDETFICFDETKNDVWIRTPPPYAIRKHQLLNEGNDNYQYFMKKMTGGAIQIAGIRALESFQRRLYLAQMDTRKISQGLLFPIYDWKDTDVWKYIYDNNLDFPDAYMYLYQVGTPINRMRLSQFFSIDTVGALVKMCQFYPDLFDRICKREPNAYMAMLYYDTELFRRKKKDKDKAKEENYVYYKESVMNYLSNIDSQPKSNRRALLEMKKFLFRFSMYFDNKLWKAAYQICIAGDPKGRYVRTLKLGVLQNRKSGAING